ncbi:MAG: HigA family addiction module antitoxin [Gammaproteobacteria bacterium]
MRPVHPGEILRDELDVLAMSAKAFAEALDVPANRISAILKGQRGITADTALRLSRYLGTTPQVWLNLQKAFELRVAELEAAKVFQSGLSRVQRRASVGKRNQRASSRLSNSEKIYRLPVRIGSLPAISNPIDAEGGAE